jgi:hypothetical protein
MTVSEISSYGVLIENTIILTKRWWLCTLLAVLLLIFTIGHHFKTDAVRP